VRRGYLAGLTAPVPTRTRILRHAIILFLTAWWGLAAFAGYRAIYQVQHLEVSATERVLRPGIRVTGQIVSSGRTLAALRLVLIQGRHQKILASRRVPANHDAAMDPRSQHAQLSVVLTPELLSGFLAGPAKLRAIGLGSAQWLRVPPPKIQELVVVISGASGVAVERPDRR
jgi:hypothetical protein